MRLTALLIAFTAAASCQQVPDPHLLYRDHQWFAFRDAVRNKPDDFMRGVVACTFNDVDGCERQMQRVLASGASKEEKAVANLHLAAIYSTLGRSRLALARYEAGAKIMGPASLPEGGGVLLKAFAAEPEISVARVEESTLPYDRNGGKLAVPVTINGADGSYFLDTGAGYSAVSESEARRVGLRVLPMEPIPVGGFTGATAPVSRIGIADKLVLGAIELRNVPFLVLPAENLMGAREGALGLQVLVALGTLYWNTNGFVRLGGASSGTLNTDRSNMAFDGNSIRAQAGFGDCALDFKLDTGGGSFLTPLFEKAFPALVQESGHEGAWSSAGFGASHEKLPATWLPEVELNVGSGHFFMRPVPIVQVPGAWGHGVIGYDVLKNVRAVTLDFRRMIWTVE